VLGMENQETNDRAAESAVPEAPDFPRKRLMDDFVKHAKPQQKTAHQVTTNERHLPGQETEQLSGRRLEGLIRRGREQQTEGRTKRDEYGQEINTMKSHPNLTTNRTARDHEGRQANMHLIDANGQRPHTHQGNSNRQVDRSYSNYPQDFRSGNNRQHQQQGFYNPDQEWGTHLGQPHAQSQHHRSYNTDSRWTQQPSQFGSTDHGRGRFEEQQREGWGFAQKDFAGPENRFEHDGYQMIRKRKPEVLQDERQFPTQPEKNQKFNQQFQRERGQTGYEKPNFTSGVVHRQYYDPHANRQIRTESEFPTEDQRQNGRSENFQVKVAQDYKE
jgi:hypothetical protein